MTVTIGMLLDFFLGCFSGALGVLCAIGLALLVVSLYEYIFDKGQFSHPCQCAECCKENCDDSNTSS